jgi:hypothetical protein
MGYRAAMTNEPATPTARRAPISAVYRLAPGEYSTAVRVLVRRSKFATGVGLIVTVMGLMSLLSGMGLESPVSFVMTILLQIVIGIALLTGWHCVPFTWYSTRKRPELFNGEMTFEMDDTGVRFRTSMYDSRVAWAYVRRARDLGRFLFFDSGTGANLFVPERAFDPAALVTVRRTLAERGLLRG